MWHSKRSYEKELLDLGPDHYTSEEYESCLKKLSWINTLLGGFRAVKKALKKLPPPKSILEIGCGGGYLCQRFAKWFPNSEIVGIDLNQKAIEHAVKAHPGICFSKQPNVSLEYAQNSFDMVCAMLVAHHMTDDELIQFLQETYRIAKTTVMINDLQRHLLAYLSFSVIAPILFSNRLIWNDGRLSIKRGFRKREWVQLLERAGFDKTTYTLHWNFAFRWTLILRKA